MLMELGIGPEDMVGDENVVVSHLFNGLHEGVDRAKIGADFGLRKDRSDFHNESSLVRSFPLTIWRPGVGRSSACPLRSLGAPALMVSRNLRKWGACVWAWNAASSLYTSYVACATSSPGMIGAGDFMAWSSFGSAAALCPEGSACGHSPHGATLTLDPQRRKRKFSPCRLWLVAGAQAGY